jgi:hypothetical protein
MVVQTIWTVVMDGYDLTAYAGRLFDWYGAYPEVLRRATWRQLEKGDSSELSRTTTQAGLERMVKIREAQAAGAVTNEIAPTTSTS